jgi:acidic type I keratin
MLKRRLIESEGDEIFEEITSSTVWRVPNRCRSVDVFIVGGGSNGSNGGAWKSGSGGRGGECKSYYNIPVSPGQEISIVVGGPSQQSYFLDSTTYNARGGYGSLGGSGLSGLDWPSYENGNPGSQGVYAFDNKYTSKYPNRYGAGGGGGAYTDYSGSTYYGGSGGSYGGGKGGNSGTQNRGDDGSDATFYGAGGGGGGKSNVNESYISYGGNGYQGIVILHYYKS